MPQPLAPDTPRPGSRAFAKLIKHWYKLAQDSGFKDIERPNPATGLVEPSSQLSAKSLRNFVQTYSPQQALYYSRLQNFLAHNSPGYGTIEPDLDRDKAWTLDPWEAMAARMLADGEPYRVIAAAGHAKGYCVSPNKWQSFNICKRFIRLAIAWNRRHAEGLDYPSDI